MQLIKGGFSYRVKKELGLNIEIWGRGYIDHRIRDANDYARHVEYTRLNPVRARIAVTMEEYPYSSAQSGIRIGSVPSGAKARRSSDLNGTTEVVPSRRQHGLNGKLCR